MNTYKYEFSYRSLEKIKSYEKRATIWGNRNEREDFKGLRSAVTHLYDFVSPETCEYSPGSDRIIIIKSEKPASVFDPIIERVCEEKYSVRRIA